MGNDIQPPLRDFGTTFRADSERSFLQTLEGGIDAKQLPQPRLTGFIEHFIINSFDRPVLIVRIASLLEILFECRRSSSLRRSKRTAL